MVALPAHQEVLSPEINLMRRLNRLATLSTEYKSANAAMKGSNHLRSKLASHSGFIKFTPFGDTRVVQNPFSGQKKDVNVMNNTTLFRNTTKLRENSIDPPMSQFEILRPDTGTKPEQTLMNDKESNVQAVQILDSSFSSNFPFFSHEASKEEFYNHEGHDFEVASRAKTPGMDSHASQRINRINSMSPKGILKKPHTAQYGMRKQVHYGRRNLGHKERSVQLNNHQIEDMSQSSYFNSVRTERNIQVNSEANKLKKKLFKNAKERQKPQKMDHCTLKQILQYKNEYKFYNTKLFKNRRLQQDSKKHQNTQKVTKILDYQNDNIYESKFDPNVGIMNSHARKNFKSIDNTQRLKKMMKKSKINPEVSKLYKKYGIFSMVTKARPHSGYESNINIQENKVAAGSGFKGALARNTKRKFKLDLKKPKSKSIDQFGKRNIANKTHKIMTT